MKKIFLISIILALFSTTVSAETIRIKVTSSKPIYKTVTVKTPYTYYEDVEVSVPYNCGHSRVNRNEIGLDTVVGSVLGVVVGNQIGRGNGRVAAKIAGGIGGGYIANQMREGSEQTCYRTEIVQKRFTDYEYEQKEKIVAYKNCGYIGNRKICTKNRYKQRYIIMHY